MLLGTNYLFTQLCWLLHFHRNAQALNQATLKTNKPRPFKVPSKSIWCVYTTAQKTQASFLLLLLFYWQICSQTLIGKQMVLFKFLSFIDVNAYTYYLQYFPSPWHGCLMFRNSAWVIPPKGKTLVLTMDKNGWALGSSMFILVSWIE